MRAEREQELAEREQEREQELAEQEQVRAEHDIERERGQIERERERLDHERERLDHERAKLEKLQERLEERQGELEDLEEEIEELEEELDSAGDVKEVLDVVTERIPNLMRGIQETIYSPEQNKKMAEAIAVFYKTLIEAGMEKREASALTMTHAMALQSQLRPSRQTLRMPHIPELPEMPEMPEMPDATRFRFRAGRTDDSESAHDEESST